MRNANQSITGVLLPIIFIFNMNFGLAFSEANTLHCYFYPACIFISLIVDTWGGLPNPTYHRFWLCGVWVQYVLTQKSGIHTARTHTYIHMWFSANCLTKIRDSTMCYVNVFSPLEFTWLKLFWQLWLL